MARRFTIGRDRSCDIPIADDSVSRLHAEIWLADDGALMLADRGSSNGTTLLRGDEAYPLRQDVILPGDQVRFGRALLAVQDLVAAVEAKFPKALTPKTVQPTKAGAMAPPPPPPPPPKPMAMPPPLPTLPSVPAATVPIRCSCGAIKMQGQPCPSCLR